MCYQIQKHIKQAIEDKFIAVHQTSFHHNYHEYATCSQLPHSSTVYSPQGGLRRYGHESHIHTALDSHPHCTSAWPCSGIYIPEYR